MLIVMNELLFLWYMLYFMWVIKLDVFLIEVFKVYSVIKFVNVFDF